VRSIVGTSPSPLQAAPFGPESPQAFKHLSDQEPEIKIHAKVTMFM